METHPTHPRVRSVPATPQRPPTPQASYPHPRAADQSPGPTRRMHMAQAGRSHPTVVLDRAGVRTAARPGSCAPPDRMGNPPPTSQQPTVAGSGGWARKLLVFSGIAALLLACLVFLAGLLGYTLIALQLPSPEELRTRSISFASSQIYDRNGRLMWELMDPTGGKRNWVPLSRISPYLQQATIATEDRFFYANVGVDAIAIMRALYYNTAEGEIVSGGSTITQQLAKNVLLDPEERNQETLSRKIREAVLAVELNRRYTKDQILEIYLNQIYYGNLAYGIEAASQVYFGKTAADLTLAEAALLAGLPQSPSVHDPIVNPDAAKARQRVVLDLMVEAGYINPAQAVVSFQEQLTYSAPMIQFEAPHFITYVRELVEATYGPDLLYREPGIRIQTTLDPDIQAVVEEEVMAQVDALHANHVTNGAAVVLDTKTGEILAMVGSRDFYDETIAGQVNIAVRPRQPGSAIKPLTYLAAFEHGWTPSTLVMDVPVVYPDGGGGEYVPRNYDGTFRGPVLVRRALANSLNIPALKTLEHVGIPALKEMASRLGITTLTRDDYGLSLTLGGGEVTLLELTGAYEAIGNGGCRLPPVAILRITDSLGRVISEYQPHAGQCALRADHSYLITNILADDAARVEEFGANSPLDLSRPAAVKTGTTDDFRDSWAVGYTPDIVVGAWVGNADNTPMRQVSGLAGSAVIWHNIMERTLAGKPVRDFERPATVVQYEICADSGTQPSPTCPRRTTEIFAHDQPPLGADRDIYQTLRIDTARNCVAGANAPTGAALVERNFQVYPVDGQAWALEHGIEQPPPACPEAQAVGAASITWPIDGQTVQGVIVVQGVAMAANFAYYTVEYGLSWGPQAFGTVAGPYSVPVESGPLGQLDTRLLPNGPYTLRVMVYDRVGGSFEGRRVVLVNNPQAWPTDTRAPTTTLVPVTATLTPLPATQVPETPTEIAKPTLTPVADTPTPTETTNPTDTVTPVPTGTETPTIVPTATFTVEPTATSEPTLTPEPTVTVGTVGTPPGG